MQLSALLPLITTVINLIGIKKGKETEVKSITNLSDRQKRKMLKEIQKNKIKK